MRKMPLDKNYVWNLTHNQRRVLHDSVKWMLDLYTDFPYNIPDTFRKFMVKKGSDVQELCTTLGKVSDLTSGRLSDYRYVRYWEALKPYRNHTSHRILYLTKNDALAYAEALEYYARFCSGQGRMLPMSVGYSFDDIRSLQHLMQDASDVIHPELHSVSYGISNHNNFPDTDTGTAYEMYKCILYEFEHANEPMSITKEPMPRLIKYDPLHDSNWLNV